ncbi:hypothetical protein C5167_012970 [Papaver somniferum]|uniref:Uncharacterized protein n=1 Tax=Papaver somniferum TaxID=3469 RepID=A0A4Y7IZ03_PAPSO|nr:hypothetical protein C5167_012970 [Papaver somniferum]
MANANRNKHQFQSNMQQADYSFKSLRASSSIIQSFKRTYQVLNIGEHSWRGQTMLLEIVWRHPRNLTGLAYQFIFDGPKPSNSYNYTSPPLRSTDRDLIRINCIPALKSDYLSRQQSSTHLLIIIMMEALFWLMKEGERKLLRNLQNGSCLLNIFNYKGRTRDIEGFALRDASYPGEEIHELASKQWKGMGWQ